MSITTDIQLQKSKLNSKREHLEALLSKRARIDYEIKVLKQSLRRSARKSEKQLSEQFKNLTKDQKPVLESNGPLALRLLLEQVDPDLPSQINELDDLYADIVEILERT